MSPRRILYLLGVITILSLTVGFMVFTNNLRAVSSEEFTQEFVVEPGQGVKTIAKELEDAGLIRSAFAFQLYARIERIAGSFQAGAYFLSPSLSSQEIARMLSVGEVRGNEVTIKILEGWSNAKIAEYLGAQKAEMADADSGSSQEEVYAAEILDALNVTDSRIVQPEKSYAFFSSKPASASLEGFLFPDTYRIFDDFDTAEIVGKMLDNFEAKVTPLLPEVRASGRTLFEILTVASIIDREVMSEADMKNAADVFWKRLDEGIPLQSDATVNYVTGKSATRPSLKDIEIDSPYNTYKYAGLPPGPIGNPGLKAIEAALRPTPNPYYYFLTTEDGTAIFAETLDEHNANKAHYLN